MTPERILQIQSSRGAKAVGREVQHKSIELVISDCRKYIQDKSDSYRELEPELKRGVIKELIISYVMGNPVVVEGYTEADGSPDTNRLVDKLVEEITDYGILTNAMINPDIYEIRCNGKEIKVEVKGRIVDLLDKDGNIVSFDSVEQQDIVLRKTLGDVRLTPKDALVNARTIEGYRIAAVHSSAISRDPDNPSGDAYHAFVLRKFRKIKMSLADIVQQGTMSDNMGKLLSLMAGGFTFFTVGPTASGKTTTNNAILQEVPDDIRTLLIQNPSEIDLLRKDSSGRVINDVLHLEAKDMEHPTPNDPTMVNELDHALRLSPTFVCLGEIRTDAEFTQGMKILLAGHSMNTTYHAASGYGAVSRYLSAYLGGSGNKPAYLALQDLTSYVDFVIVQRFLRDGRRKIVEISEVVGIDPDNEMKPLLNTIYKFKFGPNSEYGSDGKVKRIDGQHIRVGKLSERAVDKLYESGVPRERYEFLLKDVDLDNPEVETYTGQGVGSTGVTGDKDNFKSYLKQ